MHKWLARGYRMSSEIHMIWLYCEQMDVLVPWIYCWWWDGRMLHDCRSRRNEGLLWTQAMASRDLSRWVLRGLRTFCSLPHHSFPVHGRASACIMQEEMPQISEQNAEGCRVRKELKWGSALVRQTWLKADKLRDIGTQTNTDSPSNFAPVHISKHITVNQLFHTALDSPYFTHNWLFAEPPELLLLLHNTYAVIEADLAVDILG